MNENTAYCLIVCVAIIAMVSAMGFDLWLKHETETKTEAIRAGLVQNDNGHWVQPTTLESVGERGNK